MSFDTGAYGGVFAELISEKRLNPLDGGEENTAAKSALDALAVQSAFAGKKVVDEDMAQACISGMWLYHNFLDASHTISQGIHTADWKLLARHHASPRTRFFQFKILVWQSGQPRHF